MPGALDTTTLNELERRTVARFVELLEERLGDDLVAVWLYGSRARGEQPGPESDVDLMIVTRGGDSDSELIHTALWEAAETEDANPFQFSTQNFDPEWIEDRRRIKSFYIQEVDRDKVVLSGSEL